MTYYKVREQYDNFPKNLLLKVLKELALLFPGLKMIGLLPIVTAI